MQDLLGLLTSMYSLGKDILILLIKIVPRLSLFWKYKKLFGNFIKYNSVCYISLSSIYFKCNEPNSYPIPYKKRYPMPGGSRIDLPWIRPHDSQAASKINSVFSDFIKKIEIVSDESLDEKMIEENIVCIGGQTNWIFWKFVYEKNIIKPLEYKIDKDKNEDCFFDSKSKTSFKSNDKDFNYGLFAVVENIKNPNKKFIFITGLDSDSTLETANIIKNQIKLLYDGAKQKKLCGKDFYCIIRFRRMFDKLVPLTLDSFIMGEINKNSNNS